MMYLFHRIEDRLDGTPSMILIDEGWKALDDEVFAARIGPWLKTLRKRNALVGFVGGSAREALYSRAASALVEQTATMIFTPNSRVRAKDYCNGFGLTRRELGIIRNLPAHSRCFLVWQADTSVALQLDLSAMPEVFVVLSGRSASPGPPAGSRCAGARAADLARRPHWPTEGVETRGEVFCLAYRLHVRRNSRRRALHAGSLVDDGAGKHDGLGAGAHAHEGCAR